MWQFSSHTKSYRGSHHAAGSRLCDLQASRAEGSGRLAPQSSPWWQSDSSIGSALLATKLAAHIRRFSDGQIAAAPVGMCKVNYFPSNAGIHADLIAAHDIQPFEQDCGALSEHGIVSYSMALPLVGCTICVRCHRIVSYMARIDTNGRS